MPLSQLVYTSTCTQEMTPRVSHEIAYQSIALRNKLSLTGRVFANDSQAFAIVEGEAAMVSKYYLGVSSGPLVDSMVQHWNRPIKAREFSDYSVWLNSSEHYDYGPDVHHLSSENLHAALPDNLSAKLRIMVEVFLKPEVLAA